MGEGFKFSRRKVSLAELNIVDASFDGFGHLVEQMYVAGSFVARKLRAVGDVAEQQTRHWLDGTGSRDSWFPKSFFTAGSSRCRGGLRLPSWFRRPGGAGSVRRAGIR